MTGPMGCQQQRSSGGTNPAAAAAAAAALEAAAWFGPNGTFAGQLPIVELAPDDVTPVDDEEDEDEDEPSSAVQHLYQSTPGPATAAAVAGSSAKPEQIFSE